MKFLLNLVVYYLKMNPFHHNQNRGIQKDEIDRHTGDLFDLKYNLENQLNESLDKDVENSSDEEHAFTIVAKILVNIEDIIAAKILLDMANKHSAST